MAKLDAGEILKYDTRQVVFWTMVKNGTPFTVDFTPTSKNPTGTAVIKNLYELIAGKMTKLSLNTDATIINRLQNAGNNIFMEVTLDSTAKRAWDKAQENTAKYGSTQAKKLGKSASEGGESENILKLKRLYKDENFKDGKTPYNRGNVAEGIMSAALVARFAKEKPAMVVQRHDVEKVIEALGNNPANVVTIGDKFTSPNMKPKKGSRADVLDPDQIIWILGLATADMKALVTPRVRSGKMDGIYDAAVKYANSENVVGWDRLFYENGRRDIITVKAQGLEDQKGTKKDIDVSFTDENGNNKKTSMEISVKVAGIKQFGQRGGTEFPTLQKLMSEFYGANLNSITEQYKNHMNAIPQEADKALSLAYQTGAAKRGGYNKITKWDKVSVKRFADATKYHAQKEDGEVPQLNLLDKGIPTLKDFNRIHDNIEKYEYFSIENVETDSKGGKLPRHIIRAHEGINDTKGIAILELRVKIETKNKGTPKEYIYYRSVVENSKDTGKLTGVDIEYIEGA